MTSIYAHIRAHVPASGPGLSDGGDRLPDDTDPVYAGALVWSPGALDGVMGHHAQPGEVADRVSRVHRLLDQASRGRQRDRARRALYAELEKGDLLLIVDQLLDRVRFSEPLHDVARWLAREAEHRDPVKLGIGLLGLGATAEDREVLRTLARHEEFTLYAAVALVRTSEDPETELWGLAKNVDHWGRIDIVERLEGTERREIKDWLLRGGFRNSVTNEYTAFIAATTGDLVAALQGPVDRELGAAAVDIMRALIAGGPARDITDYAEGPRALGLVLRDVERQPSSPAQGLLAAEALALLEGGERLAHWLPDARADLAARCRRILADPAWPGLVTAALTRDESIPEFRAADQLAQLIGIDTFGHILERLRKNPFSFHWSQAMARVDEERLPALLALADVSFRPDELGGGPADEEGSDPAFRRHWALERLVVGLERFPGRGWPHVRTALSSPVIGSRNTALGTLAAWGTGAWPDEARDVLAEALTREPREDVRRRIERLLAGEPLDGPTA